MNAIRVRELDGEVRAKGVRWDAVSMRMSAQEFIGLLSCAQYAGRTNSRVIPIRSADCGVFLLILLLCVCRWSPGTAAGKDAYQKAGEVRARIG